MISLHVSGNIAIRAICNLVNAQQSKWNLVKQEIVRIANEQYQSIWVNGTKIESEPAIQRIIRTYWEDGPYRNISIPSHIQIPRSAWSAAFIAWVVQQAGGGDKFSKIGDEPLYRTTPKGGFRPIAHWRYVSPSIQNRRINSFVNPFYAYPADEMKPEMGDIVVKSRRGSRATYENHMGKLTHGDIVVQVNNTNIVVVGEFRS